MNDDATQVVMTETQQELLNEVRTQYERRQEQYKEAGGDPDTRQGNLTCYLPFEMLREAFKGEPPEKESGR